VNYQEEIHNAMARTGCDEYFLETTDSGDGFTAVLYFTLGAHSDQVRKYSDIPYVVHPIEVVGHLLKYRAHFDEAIFPCMICAALLHDVVEDTPIVIEQIGALFGPTVEEMVDGLTDKTVPEDGNRATRKRMDRDRMEKQNEYVQSIKCADIFCNLSDMEGAPEGFRNKFLKEKHLIVQVMDKANETMKADLVELIGELAHEYGIDLE